MVTTAMIKKALELIKSLRSALDQTKGDVAQLRLELLQKDAVIAELRRQLDELRTPQSLNWTSSDTILPPGFGYEPPLQVHDSYPASCPDPLPCPHEQNIAGYRTWVSDGTSVAGDSMSVI